MDDVTQLLLGFFTGSFLIIVLFGIFCRLLETGHK